MSTSGTTYPKTMPKFKIGDQVVLVGPHLWYTKVYQEMDTRTVYKVEGVDPDYGSDYAFKTHTYEVSYGKDGEQSSHVDEDCLRHNYEPVSERELAEALKSLGVQTEEV